METILFLLILLTTLIFGARALGLTASGKGRNDKKWPDLETLPEETRFSRILRERQIPEKKETEEYEEACVEC